MYPALAERRAPKHAAHMGGCIRGVYREKEWWQLSGCLVKIQARLPHNESTLKIVVAMLNYSSVVVNPL